MEFNHILIRYGEMALKGKNRRMFIAKLQHNLQQKLRAFENAQVKKTQGRMFVILNGEDHQAIMNICRDIFGIQSLSLALKVDNELDQIKEGALWALNTSDNAHTFKITTRRVDKGFPVGSQELNQVLGGHLLTNTDNITVDVHNPDVEIKVEIREEATYITSHIVKGSGGLPVGTAGKTLLLMSGGIDSPVAGYLAMKRGVQLEAIHFHSPPYTSDRARQKVIDLTKKLTRFGHSIRIHMIPFTKVQQTIFREMPSGYGMTIMRRIMLKISESVCEQEKILSMTTGESLGQVASQTMTSMNTINEVTNYPILRPLISMDKDDIIGIAREIDTYDISILPYDDCCTIFVPKSPKTRPRREKTIHFENQYDFTSLIDEAIAEKEIITIKDDDIVEDVFEDLL